MFDLQDEIAIVTGGNGGFGRAISRSLAEFGANVIVADLDLMGAKKIIKDIENMGRSAFSIELDVTKKNSVKKMVDEVMVRYGKIDILINCHGTANRDPAIDLKEEDWDRVIDVNLKGVFLCCQAVGKIMIQRKKGKIINIASSSGFIGIRDISAYSTSKAGVIQLTRALAGEWANHNIRVNAIAPTYFWTDARKEFLQQNYEEIVRTIPLGKLGTPDELIGLVLLLACDKSVEMITGQTFIIDGGQNSVLPLFQK